MDKLKNGKLKTNVVLQLILDFRANIYPFIIKSTSVHGRKATYFDEANDGWTNFKWLSRLQHTIHMRWNNRTL